MSFPIEVAGLHGIATAMHFTPQRSLNSPRRDPIPLLLSHWWNSTSQKFPRFGGYYRPDQLTVSIDVKYRWSWLVNTSCVADIPSGMDQVFADAGKTFHTQNHTSHTHSLSSLLSLSIYLSLSLSLSISLSLSCPGLITTVCLVVR